jgi:hypothetical protein
MGVADFILNFFKDRGVDLWLVLTVWLCGITYTCSGEVLIEQYLTKIALA